MYFMYVDECGDTGIHPVNEVRSVDEYLLERINFFVDSVLEGDNELKDFILVHRRHQHGIANTL